LRVEELKTCSVPCSGARKASKYEGSVFYALSKTLDLALSPLVWSLGLSLWACWLLGRRRRLGFVVGAIGWGLLYVASTAACARLLWLEAEAFDLPEARSSSRYDAVVVLGGFAQAAQAGSVEYATGVDRMFRAWELLRSGRANKAIIVAGSDSKPVEAELIANALVELGVARSRLILGTESRNTRQNALEAQELAQRHGLEKLVITTSAYHMQRAYECFRAVGLRPDVIATDFSAPGAGTLYEMLAPRAHHLELTERVLREFAGRWVYRLQGFATRP
jgi:uncharacterized SAM-binding protein YcdF (DUF218 family)